MAPFSIGNPAAASTLQTRPPQGVAREAVETQKPIVKASVEAPPRKPRPQTEPAAADPEANTLSWIERLQREQTPSLVLDDDVADDQGDDGDDLQIETAARTPANLDKTVTVPRGDTLAGALNKAGIDRREAHAAIRKLSKVMNPRRVRAGQELTLTIAPAEDGPGRLLGLSMEKDFAHRVGVRLGEGGYESYKEKKVLERRLARVAGPIKSSLYLAATKAGLTVPVLADLIRAYSWDVDFQRDIQPGDAFEVMFEQYSDSTGRIVHYGEVIFASLTLTGTRLPIYRFTTRHGVTSYFNEKGHGAKKALMRTPIDGARLSSRYGKRRHPILGYTKKHTGVDFAAPPGTPIYAAGDGVIDYAGRKGGYGKYIRIRHNSEYATAYAHMRAYRRGMRKGKRVKQGQVIGYVGSTGRSTGPHLHYEILRNGRHTNPLKVKMPSGEKLRGKDLKRFQAKRADIERLYAALVPPGKVAEAN